MVQPPLDILYIVSCSHKAGGTLTRSKQSRTLRLRALKKRNSHWSHQRRRKTEWSADWIKEKLPVRQDMVTTHESNPKLTSAIFRKLRQTWQECQGISWFNPWPRNNIATKQGLFMNPNYVSYISIINPSGPSYKPTYLSRGSFLWNVWSST